MDPRGLRMTQTTYFSLLTHAKQTLLVILCDTTAVIGKNGSLTYRRKEGQTDVKSELVIYYLDGKGKNWQEI